MNLSKNMNNSQIAHLLTSISAAYEVKKENKFKIIAYDRAASAVEHSIGELKDFWDDGKLEDIPGIGPGIAAYLDELFRTGEVRHFDKVFKGLPPAMFELIRVPSIGPKSAYKLCKKLKIRDDRKALKLLRKSALTGKIRKIEGFGELSEKKILEALKEFGRKTKRILLPFAWQIAKEALNYLKKCPESLNAYPLGSLRRGSSTVGDVDLAVASNDPKKVIDWFIKYPKKSRLVEAGEAKASILVGGQHKVDLRVQASDSFGALLQHFTGSKQHNIHLREIALKKGLSLSEFGIKILQYSKTPKLQAVTKNSRPEDDQPLAEKLIKFKDENSFYNYLGMEWIPPELREDRGEIQAALRQAQGKPSGLPKLVKAKDIRGDFHFHSDFDVESSHDLGRHSMEEMVTKAAQLGYEYIVFAEHNPSASKHTKEEFISILQHKKDKIDKLNYSNEKSVKNREKKLLAFNSLEIDIKPDGQRAIPNNALNILDFAIVAIHSSFRMDKEKMTKRVLKAMDHPKVKILAHPTGRLLNKRGGYELDWNKIFRFCLEKEKFLEINAFPDRLDLPDEVVREAVLRGVKLVIGSDAHAKDEADLMKFGVLVARKGWATKGDIINTMGYNKIKNLLLK